MGEFCLIFSFFQSKRIIGLPHEGYWQFFQNLLKKKWRIFTRVNFLAENLFSFVSEGFRIDQSFLSASSNLMPLNRFVSVFIEAVSSLSNLFCSRMFV